ncbi:MAG TPA: amidohydrolase family protein [Bacteroidales bacterium]|nr:amidohydrolase family protein [Bacteroidales bacterium]
MKTVKYFSVLFLLLAGYALAAQSPVVAPAQKKPVILTGGTIHTGTGEVIENGLIAFSAGRITYVGKAEDFRSDKSQFESFDVTGKQIYPGLILTNTILGLVEIGAVDVTVDAREIGDLNPNVRAIAAYNTDSHVIPVVRSNGVLLAQVMPQGSLLAGSCSVVQLDAWNWEDAAYKMDNGLMLDWPAKAVPGGRQGAYFAMFGGNSASVYDINVEALEKIFSDAIAYSGVDKPVNVNLRLEALKGLFDGSKTLYLSSSEPKGIIAAVSFAKKYGVKKIVLTSADEAAWQVKDFLKENNIPLILANPLRLPESEHSDVRMPFKLPAMFMHEGFLVAVTYSSQAYPNLPFAAGITAGYGLSKEEALQTVTLNAAKILGIDDVTGSLEKGKDANIVVSDGDLLDMKTNNVIYAFINGRNISLDNKHKQLGRRFQAKYDQQSAR